MDIHSNPPGQLGLHSGNVQIFGLSKGGHGGVAHGETAVSERKGEKSI